MTTRQSFQRVRAIRSTTKAELERSKRFTLAEIAQELARRFVVSLALRNIN